MVPLHTDIDMVVIRCIIMFDHSDGMVVIRDIIIIDDNGMLHSSHPKRGVIFLICLSRQFKLELPKIWY